MNGRDQAPPGLGGNEDSDLARQMGPRTTSPTSYRVTGLPATYIGGPSCETQRVVLAWTIEGLGESGSYTIRFANGLGPYFAPSGPFTIRAGVGPSQTWDPPTGRFTLTQLVFDGGAGGRAEITSVRGLPVTGDPVSIAGPPPPCAP